MPASVLFGLPWNSTDQNMHTAPKKLCPSELGASKKANRGPALFNSMI